jgi:predicted nucleic acid-binding protein
MKKKFRVYLDTSALFAGIWSSQGGGRMILRLGELDVINILINQQVLKEIENVINRKIPNMLGLIALILDRSKIEIIKYASKNKTIKTLELVENKRDALVLSSAMEAKIDYFVALDKKHFLSNKKVQSLLRFPIGTPGDFLKWFNHKILINAADIDQI